MKVEVLACGKIEDTLNDMNIQYNITYHGKKYKVIEVEKNDAKTIDNLSFDNAKCRFSKGSGGSFYDTISVHGSNLIGRAVGKDTSYKKLTDYLNAIDANSFNNICDYAVGLAKVNGLSLSKLFTLYEG